MAELYAHALIELEDGSRIERGSTVPEDLPGLDELKEAGSVSSDEYDETKDQVAPPEEVEIEGYVYKRVSENRPSELGEKSNGN